MKIVADENIAYATDAFSAFGEVCLKKGRSITQQDLQDAEVLLVRSVTQVNQSLLADTSVKFIGTATIGVDHIDTDYLQEKNITFTSCAGCNANAVAEYVITALFHQHSLSYWQTKTIAIIGYGNVGQSVARWLTALKINYIVNDPPLEHSGTSKDLDYVDLDTALNADAISLHVPLLKTGNWPTQHLLDAQRLAKINDNTTLLNTCRGEVIDNQALLNIAPQKKLHVILDVWEHEPEPLFGLVEIANISTPHIAGYSLEGKVNGTKILHDALQHYFNLSSGWQVTTPGAGVLAEDVNINNIESVFNGNYSIQDDVREFKQIIKAHDPAQYFDKLRKNYRLRNELGLNIRQNL